MLTVTMSLTSGMALAAPNFECDIFNKDSVKGKFSMSGKKPETQVYDLKLSERNAISTKLKGNLFLKGMMPFNQLPLETQKDMTNAMNSSRRPDLKTGPMVVYGNTPDQEESTMSVYLMPSGEIAYLQIGYVEAFCM